MQYKSHVFTNGVTIRKKNGPEAGALLLSKGPAGGYQPCKSRGTLQEGFTTSTHPSQDPAWSCDRSVGHNRNRRDKIVAFADIGMGPSGQQSKRTCAKRKLRMPEPNLEENLSSDEDMPEIPPVHAEEESSGKESEVEEPKEEGEEYGRDEQGEKESKSKEIKEGLYVIVRFPGKKKKKLIQNYIL